MVNTDASSEELNLYLNSTGAALNVVNTTILSYLRQAILLNDTQPCLPNSTLPGQPKLFCQALREQDLTQTLLSVRYPVEFCQSKSDLIVDFGNVPDISLNPDYLSLYVATGSHQAAGEECVIQIFFFYFNGMDGYKIPQNAVCTSKNVTSYPTPAPSSHMPTCAPKKSPCTSSSECCNASKIGCFGTKASSRQCLPCAKKNMNCSQQTDCCKSGTKFKCQKGKCVACKKRGKACRSGKQCCSNKCKLNKRSGNFQCK